MYLIGGGSGGGGGFYSYVTSSQPANQPSIKMGSRVGLQMHGTDINSKIDRTGETVASRAVLNQLEGSSIGKGTGTYLPTCSEDVYRKNQTITETFQTQPN